MSAHSVSPLPKYLENALKMAALNIPVVFFPGGQKENTLSEWQNLATIDSTEIVQRANANPNWTNYSCVAKAVPGGRLMLDDDGGIRAEYEKSYGAMSPTLKNRSQSGSFHYVFEHTAKSIAFQNEIGKAWISEKKPDGKGELWSLRMHNAYIVGPGSTFNGREYEVAYSGPIIPIPDTLLNFLIARFNEAKKKYEARLAADDTAPVLSGSRNSTLASVAGKWRNAGVSEDSIISDLHKYNQERCQPPLSDQEVETIGRSISRYKQGDPSPQVLFGGQPGGSPVAVVKVASELEQLENTYSRLDTNEGSTRPVFPAWVMHGTSLYEGLVKPAVATSSKYPEFIWMAGVQVMLNYMFGRVRIHMQDVGLNLYLGFISPYGRFFKSSSAELAHDYFASSGFLTSSARTGANADGRIVTMQAGSPEGFGLKIASLSGTNVNGGVPILRAIMYNDELSHFVSKASIDGSVFASTMLTFYESGEYSNYVKNKKASFSFASGSYCFSWLFCCTNPVFDRLWPKIAGANSGIKDRMFFLVSPAKAKPTTVYSNPFFMDAAVITTQNLCKAEERAVYHYDDPETAAELLAGMDPRSMQLVQKFALFFAVDLGLDEITGGCLERARALVDYRNQAMDFLSPLEADNEQARIQLEIRRMLRRHKGKMSTRELCRSLEYERFGMDKWKWAYKGLVDFEEIIEFTEKTESGQTRKMVGLRKWDEDQFVEPN